MKRGRREATKGDVKCKLVHNALVFSSFLDPIKMRKPKKKTVIIGDF